MARLRVVSKANHCAHFKANSAPLSRIEAPQILITKDSWSKALLERPQQIHYLVRRPTEPAESAFIRCTWSEARYEAEAGAHIWRVAPGQPQRLDLRVFGRPPRSRPFVKQEEEVSRLLFENTSEDKIAKEGEQNLRP